MFSGFTLSYQGKVYTTDATTSPDAGKTGLDRLKAEFSEIGALVIRYHIGQGQRAGLLQQVARDDYADNPVEKPAHGKDDQQLFSAPADASQVSRDTRMLEESSHYSLGRGKLLNDRAQPLVHVNAQIRGEQALWDVMHSPVWGSGIALAPQLKDQGFVYVTYPEGISDEDHQRITSELMSGKFSIRESHDGEIIKLNSGIVLATANITDTKVTYDPLNLKTKQNNRLLVDTGNGSAPMGWIISKSRKKCVPHDISDHLMRIIQLAKGGFYELSPLEQQVIQTGLLKNNGMGLFTQNQVFNSMSVIFQDLERDYGFDPSTLLQEKALILARKRINALTEKDNGALVEDFLTGVIITEMVQHLRITQNNSERTALPKRFNNTFKITQNNALAIAHAFQIKNAKGQDIIEYADSNSRLLSDPDLIDIKINGKLVDPQLNNPKHIACILSTGILVAEQMILEQLLKDALVHGDEHPHAKKLRELLGNDDVYRSLIKMATTKTTSQHGLQLGLQFPECDDLIMLLRESLWGRHENLITIVKKLNSGNYVNDEINQKYIHKGLEKLFTIGETLQRLDATSVREHHSRGINAGVTLIIKQLCPRLYADLAMQDRIETAVSTNKFPLTNSHHHTQDDADAGMCPYLGRMNDNSNASPANQESESRSSTTIGFFSNKTMAAIVAGTSVAVGYAISQLL